MTELLGKSKLELQSFLASWNEPTYRATQLYHALYRERKFNVAQMTNLPSQLRARLAAETTITLPTVRQRYHSTDGSVRYLLSLPNPDVDAHNRPQRPASVEAVYMPTETRQTICISTQAGCAVDCQFCLTAQLGLIRNLTPGEIVGQVLLLLEENKPALSAQYVAQGKQINVVLMGQGEPLLNYDNVMAAMRIVLDTEAAAISPKHVTLSTSGIVPGIERLGQEPIRPKLAISLNASSDEQRNTLMPINKKYPLARLLAACKAYPLRAWEYLMFEYVMLGGVNDSPEDARRVARLLSPLNVAKINLIPWNPGKLPFQEPTPERIDAFRQILFQRNIPNFIRYSRGRDVMAACGQLALMDTPQPPIQISSVPQNPITIL
jgi:23S rRNA (adenine2503-C2)-methyltransferase